MRHLNKTLTLCRGGGTGDVSCRGGVTGGGDDGKCRGGGDDNHHGICKSGGTGENGSCMSGVIGAGGDDYGKCRGCATGGKYRGGGSDGGNEG